MTALRTTVIVKTDVYRSTEYFRLLSQDELSDLLEDHKRLVVDTMLRHAGSMIKGEGDSFWIVFPSVTAAVMAASEMLEEIAIQQTGKVDEQRLAIRVAITVGDVLHHDDDIFGDTVTLAARIEAITPPDEIYLSQAAWLALNRAEVKTEFVGEYALKGMEQPERVYRVAHQPRVRVISGQTIVFLDVDGFSAFVESHPSAETADLLVHLDGLITSACKTHGGVTRTLAGDTYCLTFEDAVRALAVVDELAEQWTEYTAANEIPCYLHFAVHKGDFYHFRSFLFGSDISTAVSLANSTQHLLETDAVTLALVSGPVRKDVQGTDWEPRLQRIKPTQSPALPRSVHTLLEEDGVYRLALQ